MYLTYSKILFDNMSQEDRIDLYHHYQGIKIYFYQHPDKVYELQEDGGLKFCEKEN